MNLIKLNLTEPELALGSALQRIALRFWSFYNNNKEQIDVILVDKWKDELFKDVRFLTVKTVVKIKERELHINCKSKVDSFTWIIKANEPLYLCANLKDEGSQISEVNLFAIKYEV